MNLLSDFELLRQGAEARIYHGNYLGQKAIIKERFSKKYRHPDLDTKLTKERVKAEARALIKCKKIGVRTPTLYLADEEYLIMEYLQCPTARDYIRQVLASSDKNEQREILFKVAECIGQMLGKLHKNNIIHGDMTTSNVLLENVNETFSNVNVNKINVCVIDFGLGSTEGSAEDKGVDLYVLERALISAHPNTEFMFQVILQTYQNEVNDQQVMKKYEEIRLRGRKRDMVG